MILCCLFFYSRDVVTFGKPPDYNNVSQPEEAVSVWYEMMRFNRLLVRGHYPCLPWFGQALLHHPFGLTVACPAYRPLSEDRPGPVLEDCAAVKLCFFKV